MKSVVHGRLDLRVEAGAESSLGALGARIAGVHHVEDPACLPKRLSRNAQKGLA